MKSVKLTFEKPMCSTARRGNNVTNYEFRDVVFDRRGKDDPEPSEEIVRACLSQLRDEEGSQPSRELLLSLKLEDGIRRVARAMFKGICPELRA